MAAAGVEVGEPLTVEAALDNAHEDFIEASRQNREYIEAVVADGLNDPVIQSLVKSAQGRISPDIESKMALRVFQVSAALRAAHVAAGRPFIPSDVASGWLVERVRTSYIKLRPSEARFLPRDTMHLRSQVDLRSIANPDLEMTVDTGLHPAIDFLIATRRGPDGNLRGINLLNASLGKLQKGSDMEPRVATQLDEIADRATDVVTRAIKEGKLVELLMQGNKSNDTVLGRAITNASEGMLSILSGEVPGNGLDGSGGL